MKRIDGFENVQASGDGTRLPEGGYVLKIKEVKDNAEKQYLEVFYDIAEGEYRGYYEDDFWSDKPYAHRAFVSYTDKALGIFKSFTNSVEDSNAGFKWDWNEQALVGKIVGAVFGKELYTSNSGDDKERLRLASWKSAQNIRDGKWNMPKVKDSRTTSGIAPSNAFMSIPDGDDTELPFN